MKKNRNRKATAYGVCIAVQSLLLLTVALLGMAGATKQAPRATAPDGGQVSGVVVKP